MIGMFPGPTQLRETIGKCRSFVEQPYSISRHDNVDDYVAQSSHSRS
jgi:hypothetical protein